MLIKVNLDYQESLKWKERYANIHLILQAI